MSKNKERWHFTAPYIMDPQHPVTVNLIGAGGSGSQMLTQLSRIDHSLKKLGHVGLHVTMYDPDIVTEANLGRQLFSAADLGMNKAIVLITRMNQYMGTSWNAIPELYESKIKHYQLANFTISCVDSVEARKSISVSFDNVKQWGQHPYDTPYYWMDLGNMQYTGQFVIGSSTKMEQPQDSGTLETVPQLKNVFQRFPTLSKQKVKETGPSCSLAEALHKQDLFINSMLVQVAANCLWKMFREGKINYHGAFVNLKTLDISPIYL